MKKLAIFKNEFESRSFKSRYQTFEGEQYIIDLDRRAEKYEVGDLICFVNPFAGYPICLEIAISANGALKFRSWEFSEDGNQYLHTYETPDKFKATQEQIDTVNGLFSGRIRFEGLKIAVGATVQSVCPIDVEKEEKLTGEKIFLNR